MNIKLVNLGMCRAWNCYYRAYAAYYGQRVRGRMPDLVLVLGKCSTKRIAELCSASNLPMPTMIVIVDGRVTQVVTA